MKQSITIVMLGLLYSLACSGETLFQEELSADNSVCEPESFYIFLERFFESEDMQRKYTRFPLQRSYVDMETTGLELDHIVVEESTSYSQEKFPIMESKGEIEKANVYIESDAISKKEKLEQISSFVKTDISGDHAWVTRGPDVGYVVRYFFKYEDCWRLIRIEDSST